MDYADYLMLLSPPEDIIYDISRYKKASGRKIGSFESMDARAHISIHHAERQKTFVMEPVLLRITRRLNTIPPVTLHINNFNYFKHGDKAMTIYAKVDQTEAIEKWFKLLIISMNLKKAAITPHITVARNISPADFIKLWPHFEKAKYEAIFTVNELLVLKRDTFGYDKHWKKHLTIEFKNQFTRSVNNL